MIGATEAARLLGVTKPTLYAYVSRGLIERRTAVDGRTSLYPRDQIEQLAGRRRDRAPAERPSIDVQITSAITQLDDEHLRYRGQDAGDLVGQGFESVASVLWSGRPGDGAHWSASHDDLDRCLAVVRIASADALDALTLSAATLSSRSAAAVPSGADAARRLIAVAPSVLGGPRRGTVAERFTAAYVPAPSDELVAAVDTALVLLADHELASSTLAVRVAASVRSDPFAALQAGLAVVAGPLHGGASATAAALVERALTRGAAGVVADVLDRGERLAGFGHSVYRRGDPRVGPLLDAIRTIPGATEVTDATDAVIAEAGRRIAHLPNVDLALGALLVAGGLPVEAPLFAVARLAGWGAHYDEELAERPVRFRGLTRLR